MKVLFIHFSDLLYPTGTTMMYRRIFGELSKHHDIAHVIGFLRNGRSEQEIAEQYAKILPRIKPICLRLNNTVRVYYRTREHFPINRLLTVPGRSLRCQFRKIIDREAPDLLWWSGDYLEESFSSLFVLRESIRDIPIHISIFDPPEIFAPEPGSRRRKVTNLYAKCLPLARSFSCIGDQLQKRLKQETGKPVYVLTDFADMPEQAPRPEQNERDSIRVGICGRIYGTTELQSFLDSFAAAFPKAEVVWYGEPDGTEIRSRLTMPHNLRISYFPVEPRERIAAKLRTTCDLTYFSMPDTMPEFARSSVPTKLVTYAEAGLPVVFHAPTDSEVNDINKEFRIGLNLFGHTSPVQALRDTVSNSSLYVTGVGQLVKTHYSKSGVMRTAEQILASTVA